MVSPTECAASDSMAALPVSSPATSFATPTARFAPIASSTVSVLSPPDFATEHCVPADRRRLPPPHSGGGAGVVRRRCTTSNVGGTALWRRRIRSATRPVQPVWATRRGWRRCRRRSTRRTGSGRASGGRSASSSTPPNTGRRPSGPARKSEDQPGAQVVGDAVERGALPRAGRVLDLQVVAEEAVVPVERGHGQVVHREPHRPAPVGVAAEHRGRRLGGLDSRRSRTGRRTAARPGGRDGGPRATAARAG